jgi:HlyD family secretion protein
VAAALFWTAAGCGRQGAEKKEAAAAAPESRAAVAGVGCIGRILPENGTFYVSPYTGNGVIDQLKIKPGDEVSAGQVVATLRSGPYLETIAREAETRVNVARERLARVKAPPLPDESGVVNAEIARLQVQRDAAARDVERNKPLYDKDFLAKAQFDALETRVRDLDAAIAQARERLRTFPKVRPEDVAIAEAEVKVAEAESARTRQDVATSVVRAPSKARVLRVIGHPGEAVGPQGIAEFAETDRMVVVAEVYEADIGRVHEGQKAVITSDLLPAAVNGEVDLVGSQIERQEQISSEPGAPSDARIFKVRLKVPDQKFLAERINGKVNVVIQP